MVSSSYIADEMLYLSDDLNEAIRVLHAKQMDKYNYAVKAWYEAPNLAPQREESMEEAQLKRQRLIMGEWPEGSIIQNEIEIEKQMLKVKPDDMILSDNVKIVPNEIMEEEKKKEIKNEQKDKQLEGYYKAQTKFYRLLYPDLLNEYDIRFMNAKEELDMIEQRIKERKETKTIPWDFINSITSFYETAYPELFSQCKKEYEGLTIDVFMDTIKQRIKNKRPKLLIH